MTNGRNLEVADIFRECGDEFQRLHGVGLSRQQRKVIRAITACRTRLLGGHAEQCDRCGHQRIAYNSCRNRHCPKCQAGARATWVTLRERELLAVPYFHIVFTLPHTLAPLALQNKTEIYSILFRVAAQTLKEVAHNPRHLGAQIGFIAVLHTWGQNLMHHPHLHCVVPGGGLAEDETKWVSCKNAKNGKQPFFLPVRVLSRVFRGKFLHALKDAKVRQRLRFCGSLSALAQESDWNRFLNRVVSSEWVVYAKRPFGGPSQTLKYLARYTHRVAISNQRLIEFDGGRVSFNYRDYANGNRSKVMTMDGPEFMRRFLMHTLPPGFTRIRYYGFLSNSVRTANLARCRELLGTQEPDNTQESTETDDTLPRESVDLCVRCPKCKKGRMVIIEEVAPSRRIPKPHYAIALATITPRLDSS